MVKESTSRAREIGCGLRHVDVANFSVAATGGVYAHDFCTSLENKTTTALHVAIVDAGCCGADDQGVMKNMTVTLHRLAAGEKAPNMACWKEFNLTTAPSVIFAGGASANTAATIAFTTPASTNTYYVVTTQLFSDAAVTITGAQADGTLTFVNNNVITAAGAFPLKNVVSFVVLASAASKAVTLTLTPASGGTVTTLTANTCTVYPVTPWTVGLVNAIY